jgi:hypothetical protein
MAPTSSRRSCSGQPLAHVDDRTLTGATGYMHDCAAAVQESISAGAGRQSRAELAVLARDAQALPLMPRTGRPPDRFDLNGRIHVR